MSMTNEELEKLKELHSTGLNNKEIAQYFDGISSHSISYYLKKLNLRSNRANMAIKMIDDNTAECNKCYMIKELDQFQYGRRDQKYEYRYAYCRSCRKTQIYSQQYSTPETFLKNRYNRLKARAKTNNILFNLSKDYLLNQYNKQNGLCFYTDIFMDYSFETNKSRNRMSIDKIQPELGYIDANVVLCSYRVNSIKLDISLDEMKLWMPTWWERVNVFQSK